MKRTLSEMYQAKQSSRRSQSLMGRQVGLVCGRQSKTGEGKKDKMLVDEYEFHRYKEEMQGTFSGAGTRNGDSRSRRA